MSVDPHNPYAAPVAPVGDARVLDAAELVLEGQRVPAANGWLWIKVGFSLFMQQPWIWVGVAVLALLIMLLLAFVPIIGQIANVFLGPLLAGGLMIGCRAVDEGEPLTVRHLFAGFREHTGRLAMIGLVNFGVLLAFILIGSIGGFGIMALLGGGGGYGMAGASLALFGLAFVAISVPLYMAMWFAPALIVFHELPALAAMKASFYGSLKNWLAMLVYSAIFLALAILASIPAGLGWLALGPVLIGSVYAGYRDIYLSSRSA